MTDEEIKEAEEEARDDAKWLLLLLLLASSRMAQFDSESGQFRFNGRLVSVAQIRGYLQRIEKRMATRAVALLNDLDAGKLSLEAFQRGFARIVRSSHILSGALATGSIASAVRNADVQTRIAAELKYADGFVNDIKKKSAGTIKKQRARAKMYLMATAITFNNLEQKARQLMGFQTECKRVRRASESCEGCREWSGRWVAIEDMPPIGTLDCRWRCRCYLEYR